MGVLSKATVSAVGLFSKALLNIGFCSSVTVNGLDNLLHALEDDERRKGRGVITSELPPRWVRQYVSLSSDDSVESYIYVSTSLLDCPTCM